MWDFGQQCLSSFVMKVKPFAEMTSRVSLTSVQQEFFVLMTTPCSNEVWERRYLGGLFGFTIFSPRECKSGCQVGTQYRVYYIFQRWGENNYSLSLQPVESSFKGEGETGKGDLSYWDLGQWLHGGKRGGANVGKEHKTS